MSELAKRFRERLVLWRKDHQGGGPPFTPEEEDEFAQAIERGDRLGDAETLRMVTFAVRSWMAKQKWVADQERAMRLTDWVVGIEQVWKAATADAVDPPQEPSPAVQRAMDTYLAAADAIERGDRQAAVDVIRHFCWQLPFAIQPNSIYAKALAWANAVDPPACGRCGDPMANHPTRTCAGEPRDAVEGMG